MKRAEDVLDLLKGTKIYELYEKTGWLYHKIQMSQKGWYEKTGIVCPEGCGECCRNFEPDLLESEAVYMAVWLLENQNETAQKVIAGEFPFPQNKGCPFWNENSPYHCSIYEGRAFICRLFGASGFHSKTGAPVWKPCKFYPTEKLACLNPPFFHRQYSEHELRETVNAIPPVMSNFMQQAIELTPEQPQTEPLRKILPETLKRIQWMLQLKRESGCDSENDDGGYDGDDSSPLAS